MSDGTTIAWTDATWSVTRGCSRVSAGCQRCYAERMAHRFSGPGRPFEGLTRQTADGPRWTGKVTLLPEALEIPIRWRRPRRIFVNSMSDLFHEAVSDAYIAAVFGVMAAAPQHTFLVLTKRAARMRRWFREGYEVQQHACAFLDQIGFERGCGSAFEPDTWPLPNVWLGVSVEGQQTADHRIPFLLETPAAIRFLSCEPLLGPVDLANLYGHIHLGGVADICVDALTGKFGAAWAGRGSWKDSDLAGRGVGKIDWVIAGGESGPGARPMHPQWARSLRDQCQAAQVPFFFKQWGRWEPLCDYYERNDSIREPALGCPGVEIVDEDGEAWDVEADGQPSPDCWLMAPTGKKRAGRLLDGREWNEMPEVRP